MKDCETTPGMMRCKRLKWTLLSAGFSALFVALTATAQESSISVHCPQTTVLHPSGGAGIKCDHLVAGDGMVTMADDAQKQQYIFSFARLPLPDAAPGALAEYPGWVMEQGMLAANIPAPTIAMDEDDELFLTLTSG